MSDLIHEFADLNHRPVSIDMSKAVDVADPSDARGHTKIVVQDGGLRHTYCVLEPYSEVVEKWEQARASITVQDVHDLIASVQKLAESEHERQDAILQMRTSVTELSTQVGRLSSAVSSLEGKVVASHG